MRSGLFASLPLLILCALASAEPVPIAPPDLLGAVQPQLAVAPSGKVHITFGAGNSIYYTSSADGRAFLTPVKVAEVEKLALGKRRGPRIVATDEVITIAAISHATGTLHGWNSTDGGTTWSAGKTLNTVAKSAREGLHAMAGNDRGVVALTWLDLRNGSMELWNRVSRDGGRSWDPERLAYASPDGHICECCNPSVAISPTGEIALMWRNWLGGSRDMWSVVSMDGGKTFPQPQKLGTGSWPLKGCPMDGGAVAYDATGTLATVWRRESVVYSAAAGKPEEMLASGAEQAVIAPTQGGLAKAYENGGEIMLRVNAGVPKALGKGRAPAIASNGTGVSFVAWETPDGGSPVIMAVP